MVLGCITIEVRLFLDIVVLVDLLLSLLVVVLLEHSGLGDLVRNLVILVIGGELLFLDLHDVGLLVVSVHVLVLLVLLLSDLIAWSIDMSAEAIVRRVLIELSYGGHVAADLARALILGVAADFVEQEYFL